MKRELCILSMCIGINFYQVIITTPKTVFITRHAEKTAHNQAVAFGSYHLLKSKPLSPRGWQRAYGLAPLFTMQPDITKYGPIIALFAPNPNKPYESVRPVQTITPLSKLLNIKINAEFPLTDKGMQQLVNEIKTNPAYDGKVVYVAYEHHHIPALAKMFAKNKNKTSCKTPSGWKNSVFDRIWVLEFNVDSGDMVSFQNLPQRLLMGDSKK